jgi:hypothetical protein
MHFDLNSILVPSDNLEDLILPFSNEEIDGVVANLKSDKSPVLTLISWRNDGMPSNMIFMNYVWGSSTMKYACRV